MKNPNLDGKLDPLKPALSHIGLYLSLAAYTAIGAKVSHFLFLSIWRNVATRKSHNLSIALDETNSKYVVHTGSSLADFNHGLVVRPQGCQGCQKIHKKFNNIQPILNKLQKTSRSHDWFLVELHSFFNFG